MYHLIAIKLTGPSWIPFVIFIEGCGSVFAEDMVAKAATEIKKQALDLDAKLEELS